MLKKPITEIIKKQQEFPGILPIIKKGAFMALFKDMLKSDQTLFKNPIALDFDYMPKLIPFRGNEQHRMAKCIRPLLQGLNGRNLIILGPPGVGKTVACKNVLQELEDETDAVIPIYVNCWQRNTTHKVILGICEAIDYRFVQNKKTEEIFEDVKKILNKKAAVFIFDEIDKAEDYSFLYLLLEAVYKKSIFLITNYKEWIMDLEERIKSRLLAEIMEFRMYDLKETEGILKERMSFAFYPGVFSDDAFRAIVRKSTNAGDIRIGLYLLRESSNAAEDESSKKVGLEHAESAINKLREFSAKNENELDDDAKKIFGVVKANSGKKIGELFKVYQDSGGAVSYKTFQRKINSLFEGKFVSLDKISGGTEGTTTFVTLKDFSDEKQDISLPKNDASTEKLGLDKPVSNEQKKSKKGYAQLTDF